MMVPALNVYLDAPLAPAAPATGPALSAKVGVAHFTLRRGGVSTTFRYGDSYLAQDGAYAIDPAMPLVSGAHHVDGLPGAFRDSLPDRWGRTLIEKEHRKVASEERTALRALDDVDFLIGVMDKTREGALRFALSAQNGQTEPAAFLAASGDIPKTVELKELLRASERVVRDEASLREIKELLDAGSGSLGGARPKASVRDEEKLLLAKFPHPADRWNVMGWEKTSLDIAQKAGINVPRSRLVSLGGKAVLLVERFDRDGSRLEGARIPYLSAMTLLGAEDGESRDYLELGEALPGFVTHAGEQLFELFRRVCLNVAIHNTDDHLRNIGFVRRGKGWRFAPAFDVNPNPYERTSRATGIGGNHLADPDEILQLPEIAEFFGIPGGKARAIIEEVMEAVSSWKTLAKRNGCPQSEVTLFEPIFEPRLEALRQLLRYDAKWNEGRTAKRPGDEEAR